ncbi:MAG: glycosyltransferase, partial [Spirochaetes bacterium]|nr:glycosyltransferase [Spirochaetota bacterium]
MPKILIYANANNYHSIKRSLAGQEAGFEVIWVSAEQVNLPDVKSYFLPPKYSRSLISRAIFEPFLIFNTIRRVKPDIIHVHFASKGLAAVPVSRYHPLIVSCQGGDIFPDQAYRGFYAPFVRYLLDNADCITSMTDYMDLTLK